MFRIGGIVGRDGCRTHSALHPEADHSRTAREMVVVACQIGAERGDARNVGSRFPVESSDQLP